MGHYECKGCGNRDCICPKEPHDTSVEDNKWIIWDDVVRVGSIDPNVIRKNYHAFLSKKRYDTELEALEAWYDSVKKAIKSTQKSLEQLSSRKLDLRARIKNLKH
jgi:hypothetical protein